MSLAVVQMLDEDGGVKFVIQSEPFDTEQQAAAALSKIRQPRRRTCIVCEKPTTGQREYCSDECRREKNPPGSRSRVPLREALIEMLRAHTVKEIAEKEGEPYSAIGYWLRVRGIKVREVRKKNKPRV